MFQQAKKIAANTISRKPDNVLPSVILRLQAQQISGTLSANYRDSKTAVQKVASNSPEYPGTCVTTEFLRSKSHSWQAHLECISCYLIKGEGVWWSKTGSSFLFLDGDDSPDYLKVHHSHIFDLCHFRI